MPLFIAFMAYDVYVLYIQFSMWSGELYYAQHRFQLSSFPLLKWNIKHATWKCYCFGLKFMCWYGSCMAAIIRINVISSNLTKIGSDRIGFIDCENMTWKMIQTTIFEVNSFELIEWKIYQAIQMCSRAHFIALTRYYEHSVRERISRFLSANCISLSNENCHFPFNTLEYKALTTMSTHAPTIWQIQFCKQ